VHFTKGQKPRTKGSGRSTEAGEEREGSRIPKVMGSGRSRENLSTEKLQRGGRQQQ